MSCEDCALENEGEIIIATPSNSKNIRDIRGSYLSLRLILHKYLPHPFEDTFHDALVAVYLAQSDSSPFPCTRFAQSVLATTRRLSFRQEKAT